MKYISTLIFITIAFTTFSQSSDEEAGVKEACMNYLDGFYNGEAAKLEKSLKKTLFKRGYFKKEGKYSDPLPMTYEEAIEYANRVKKEENFAKEGSPKEVVVLDVLDKIAAARIKAWWGYDYMLLSNEGDKWMIEEVLWQGPLKEK